VQIWWSRSPASALLTLWQGCDGACRLIASARSKLCVEFGDHGDPGAAATIRQLRKHRGQLAALIEDAGRGKLSAPAALLSAIGHHLEAGAREASKSNSARLAADLGRTAVRLRGRITLPSGI
jgi:predicted HD phosphohydrolase